jgi:PadR family transcriptional regulator PadR
MAEGSLALNQGTIYRALLRLEQKGWITSEWAPAKITGAPAFIRTGRKHLVAETESSARTVAMVNRLLEHEQ